MDQHKIKVGITHGDINGIGYDLVIEEDRSATEIEHRSYVLLRRKVIVSWIFAVL